MQDPFNSLCCCRAEDLPPPPHLALVSSLLSSGPCLAARARGGQHRARGCRITPQACWALWASRPARLEAAQQVQAMPQSHPSSQLHPVGRGDGWHTCGTAGAAGGRGAVDIADRLGLPFAAPGFPPRAPTGNPRVSQALEVLAAQLWGWVRCHPTAHLQASSGFASLEQGSQRCPAGLGQQEQALEQSHASLQSQLPVEHLGQAQCFPMVKCGWRVGGGG